MSIFPLPVFEADADPHHRSEQTDAEILAALEPPTSVVVRFGAMKMLGEYPYDGGVRAGCGTKFVVRTHRGTELAEMVTTTCSNAGCATSVTRKEMREYIDNSGGRDFPFFTKGRVLRVAAVEDLNRHAALATERAHYVKVCKARIADHDLPMKLVDAEPILGGELLTFFYMSEERVDFRDLVRDLATEFKARIEMRQVGARDEARLTADYERCGQYCCCKNFLKVLKPISMKAAKMQKATLDPLKISGRCGRLMCCLRYEDQSYRELKANLPHRQTRVGTSEGPGVVVDTKTLVQLVLVRLEADNREIAVPVEELMDPETCPRPGDTPPPSDPLRGMPEERIRERQKEGDTPPDRRRKRRRRRGGRKRDGEKPAGDRERPSSKGPKEQAGPKPSGESRDGGEAGAKGGPKRKRRRRRGGRRHRGGGGGEGSGGGGGEST